MFPNENFDVVYNLERDGSVADFTNARNTLIVFNRTNKTIQLWCRSRGIDWSPYGISNAKMQSHSNNEATVKNTPGWNLTNIKLILRHIA